MPSQTEPTNKEKFIKKLQAIKELTDRYKKTHQEEIDSWQEAVKDVMEQIRRWLLPMSTAGLIRVQMAGYFVSEKVIGEYTTCFLVITVADNRSIRVKPLVSTNEWGNTERSLTIEPPITSGKPARYFIWEPGSNSFVDSIIQVPLTEEYFFEQLLEWL